MCTGNCKGGRVAFGKPVRSDAGKYVFDLNRMITTCEERLVLHMYIDDPFLGIKLGHPVSDRERRAYVNHHEQLGPNTLMVSQLESDLEFGDSPSPNATLGRNFTFSVPESHNDGNDGDAGEGSAEGFWLETLEFDSLAAYVPVLVAHHTSRKTIARKYQASLPPVGLFIRLGVMDGYARQYDALVAAAGHVHAVNTHAQWLKIFSRHPPEPMCAALDVMGRHRSSYAVSFDEAMGIPMEIANREDFAFDSHLDELRGLGMNHLCCREGIIPLHVLSILERSLMTPGDIAAYLDNKLAQGGVTWLLREEVSSYIGRMKREAALTCALAAHGIRLKKGLPECSEYISGTSTKTLEEVVAHVREEAHNLRGSRAAVPATEVSDEQLDMMLDQMENELDDEESFSDSNSDGGESLSDSDEGEEEG
eukprot:Opistho-2@43363